MDRSFFRFVTIHAFDRRTDWRADRQTDGQTEFSWLDRVCIACSAVKTQSTQDYPHAWQRDTCRRLYQLLYEKNRSTVPAGQRNSNTRYTLPVFTVVVFDTREHGPWTRVLCGQAPVFTVHGCQKRVSVYRP